MITFPYRIHGSAAFALALISTFGRVSESGAGVIITMVESGTNVTATLSGSIDTWSGATPSTVGTGVGKANVIRPSGGTTVFATTNPSLPSVVTTNYYTVSNFPSAFGTSTGPFAADASTASTLLFAWGRSTNNVYIAQGYTLGTLISGVLTWQNKTFANLGVTQGSYVWSWGTPATPGAGDSITLNIVPEPSTCVMALAGLACGGFAVWRRKRA